MKVLVIDDDFLALESARATLEEMGHDVITIESALGASQVIVREQPDVALVDVNMPALPGTCWLELIREGKLLSEADTPVFILFSALSSEELAVLARKTQAAGYISKQDGPEGLSRTFDQIVREREL